jgi:Family of unknown function (DUF6448)
MTARHFELVVPCSCPVEKGHRLNEQRTAKSVSSARRRAIFPQFFVDQGILLCVVALVMASSPRATAHCDGLDGPVVSAAQKALETGNVNLALIWVQKSDEAEIRRGFEHARAVRKLSAEARELADRYFCETLVRIHRAGEGAPFTGLKPAGRDLGPAIPAADDALRDGNADGMLKQLTDSLEGGLREHFDRARVGKDFDKNDLEAGRNFVKAYVNISIASRRSIGRRRVPCTVITPKESRLLTMIKSELDRVSCDALRPY